MAQSRSGGTAAVAEPAEEPSPSHNASDTTPITVFGIRHHGPGCARALRTALERLEPDLVLVEGPPDEVARDPQVKAVYLGEGADA